MRNDEYMKLGSVLAWHAPLPHRAAGVHPLPAFPLCPDRQHCRRTHASSSAILVRTSDRRNGYIKCHGWKGILLLCALDSHMLKTETEEACSDMAA